MEALQQTWDCSSSYPRNLRNTGLHDTFLARVQTELDGEASRLFCDEGCAFLRVQEGYSDGEASLSALQQDHNNAARTARETELHNADDLTKMLLPSLHQAKQEPSNRVLYRQRPRHSSMLS